MINMKKQLLFFAFSLLTITSFGQKYVTKNGHVSFLSEASTENIEAHNIQVNCAFDASNGSVVFKILIKSFEFKKAMMQEHFNENYLESDKFPDATFSGKIENIESVDITENGKYDVILIGTLTIHGESQEIKEKGTFIVDGDMITGKSVFTIKVKDYKIKIPKTVIDNIAEEIKITIDVNLKKL